MNELGVKVLLVLVAILTGIIVGLVVGVMRWATGARPVVAITNGGVAFGGTVTLVLLIENALTP